MLDCNKTLTHVSRVYNPLTRQYDMKSSTIDNCSWFRVAKSSESDSVTLSQTSVRVRIQLQGRKEIPDIKLGDILINGTVDITGLTEGQLRNKYNDSIKVKECVYNQNSNPYSNHIKVMGD